MGSNDGKLMWAMMVMELLLCFCFACGLEGLNVTEMHEEAEGYGYNGGGRSPLLVGLSLIYGAAAKGAVCLDGSVPGYHLHLGHGSGANSWLIQLEGGGWCDTIRNCLYRKHTRRGSSAYMERAIPFTGILSNRPDENPDFFNWNRVKVRYCDGASFSGDSQHQATGLHFKGHRIWQAAMEELMSQGMRHANQALLSGCSAGAVAAILRCDEFRNLFPRTTRVKCLSDGGLFLDALDISGGRTMRRLFRGVVDLQGVRNSLPMTCTNHLNPTLCFFPQHVISSISTPMFLLNTAYDTWQVQASLAPPIVDPRGYWNGCRKNYARCSNTQINFLQAFRYQMLRSIRRFSTSNQNGLFINSCFAHCQTERQDTWFAQNSPHIRNKGIAESVGNWYFDRASVKVIDCPYPCDNTCHNLVFQ